MNIVHCRCSGSGICLTNCRAPYFGNLKGTSKPRHSQNPSMHFWNSWDLWSIWRIRLSLFFVMLKSEALRRCKKVEFQKPVRDCTSGTWQVPKRYSSLPWQSSVEGKRSNVGITVKLIDIFVSAIFVCFSSDLSLHLKHVITKPPDRLENNDMNAKFHTKFDPF